jgi:hypothetical protein
MTGPNSYRLQTLEGDDISNSSNVDQLCRFYAKSFDYSKIQRQRLLTDLVLLRASRNLAAVYNTMYSKSSLYDY